MIEYTTYIMFEWLDMLYLQTGLYQGLMQWYGNIYNTIIKRPEYAFGAPATSISMHNHPQNGQNSSWN